MFLLATAASLNAAASENLASVPSIHLGFGCRVSRKLRFDVDTNVLVY